MSISATTLDSSDGNIMSSRSRSTRRSREKKYYGDDDGGKLERELSRWNKKGLDEDDKAAMDKRLRGDFDKDDKEEMTNNSDQEEGSFDGDNNDGGGSDDDDEESVEDIESLCPEEIINNNNNNNDESEEVDDNNEESGTEEKNNDEGGKVASQMLGMKLNGGGDDDEDDDDYDDGGGKQKADRGEVEVRDDASSDDVPIPLPSIPPGFFPPTPKSSSDLITTPPCLNTIVLNSDGTKVMSFDYNGSTYRRGSRGGWSNGSSASSSPANSLTKFIRNDLRQTVSKGSSVEDFAMLAANIKNDFAVAKEDLNNPLKDERGLMFLFDCLDWRGGLRLGLKHRHIDDVLSVLQHYVHLRLESESALGIRGTIQWKALQNILDHRVESGQFHTKVKGYDSIVGTFFKCCRSLVKKLLYGRETTTFDEKYLVTEEHLAILESMRCPLMYDDYYGFHRIAQGYEGIAEREGLSLPVMLPPTVSNEEDQELVNLLYSLLMLHHSRKESPIPDWKVEHLKSLGVNFDINPRELLRNEASKAKTDKMMQLLKEWMILFPNTPVPFKTNLSAFPDLKKFIPLSVWIWGLKIRCREIDLVEWWNEGGDEMDEELKEKYHAIPDDRHSLNEGENYALSLLQKVGYNLDPFKSYRKPFERIEGAWVAMNQKSLPDRFKRNLSSWDESIDDSNLRPDMVYTLNLILDAPAGLVTILWFSEIDELGHHFYKVTKQQDKEEWMVKVGRELDYKVVVIERINTSFKKVINMKQWEKVKDEKMNMLGRIEKEYQDESRKNEQGGPLVYMINHDFPGDHHHINASKESGRFHKVFDFKSVEMAWKL